MKMPALIGLVILASCLALAVPARAQDPGATQTDWRDRQTLSGDWNGARPRLEERGFTILPRITQFYQGQLAGDGPDVFEYGGKADVLARSDLSKLGAWQGLSFTVHAEVNFGQNLNGAAGAIAPINTALEFPGDDGADYSDLSSVFFGQTFGSGASLAIGKMNMIDFAATKPFMGGAGIDGFWNITFAAPPSGLVPPYLLGAILSVKTEAATYGLWIYDPTDVVNRSGLENAFSEGVTIRGNIDFPVTFRGYEGHQGLVALYSTYPGTDLDYVGDFIPPFPPGDPQVKNSRYYFAWAFDQRLYASPSNPEEGFGLFGQFGISDGNPTRLYWSALGGVSGTGMVPGRPADNWGLGLYYDALSPDLIAALDSVTTIGNEWGTEAYYNFNLAPAVSLGLDLQVIEPGLGTSTAVFTGVRLVTRF